MWYVTTGAFFLMLMQIKLFILYLEKKILIILFVLEFA